MVQRLFTVLFAVLLSVPAVAAADGTTLDAALAARAAAPRGESRVIVRTVGGGPADAAIRSVGGRPGRFLRAVGAQVAVVPDAALARLGSRPDVLSVSLDREVTAQDRLGAIVSGVFAVFGLVLAGFSLYGLLSYSVELRTSEIGIRMALGASRHSIIGLVMRQAAMRLLAGTVVGITLALGVNQLLRSVVDDLPWVAWQTLAALSLLMGAVTLVAAAIPALRATRVDPMRSLRA